VSFLSGAEQAILIDLQQSREPQVESFPIVRVTVYEAPGARRSARKRAQPDTGTLDEPSAEPQRQAFWRAHAGFAREGHRSTAERVSRWIRQLVSLDLGSLEVEELKALGWDARVLIWMRHHRLGYQCPFHRACARIGPQGDCLSPVSLPLLSEIQRTLRRMPDVSAGGRKTAHLQVVRVDAQAEAHGDD
jgi:hypothetical protein